MQKFLLTLSVLASAIVGFNSIPVQAAPVNEKPILGFVYLEETTPQQVKDKLATKKCFVFGDETHIVTQGCFSDLPGNPILIFANIFSKNINSVGIGYQKAAVTPSKNFELYLKALKNSYGTPEKIQENSSEENSAKWNVKDMVVELREGKSDPQGWIAYQTKETARKLEEDKKNKQKDALGTL